MNKIMNKVDGWFDFCTNKGVTLAIILGCSSTAVFAFIVSFMIYAVALFMLAMAFGNPGYFHWGDVIGASIGCALGVTLVAPFWLVEAALTRKRMRKTIEESIERHNLLVKSLSSDQ